MADIKKEIKEDINSADKARDKSIRIKSIINGTVNCSCSTPGEKKKGQDWAPEIYYDKTFKSISDFTEYAEAFFK